MTNQIEYEVADLRASASLAARYRRATLVCGVALAVSLTGCASMVPTESGFMRSYRALNAVEGTPNMRLYRSADKAEFHAIFIEPVQWKVGAKASANITDDERNALTSLLAASLAEKLKEYPSASRPGIGVLRLRSAITDIKASSPEANVLLSVLLIGPLDKGGVSVEIEATSGNSDERVAAMTVSEMGKTISTGGFSKLGHAKDALNHIALQFADQLK
jgi:hypothetical protein